MECVYSRRYNLYSFSRRWNSIVTITTLYYFSCVCFFFPTDCVIRSSSVCRNFIQGRALVENILEYIRILSDSYSRSHTLPREEPIQGRSPSLLTGTIPRDSRDVACIAAWLWSIYPRTLGSWIFWWREINPPCLLSMLWYSHNFKWLLLLRT